MVEQTNFHSATVVYNEFNRHAVVWRKYFVSFYNNSTDYVNKNVESFLHFEDYDEALSAAYFWCA